MHEYFEILKQTQRALKQFYVKFFAKNIGNFNDIISICIYITKRYNIACYGYLILLINICLKYVETKWLIACINSFSWVVNKLNNCNYMYFIPRYILLILIDWMQCIHYVNSNLLLFLYNSCQDRYSGDRCEITESECIIYLSI